MEWSFYTFILTQFQEVISGDVDHWAYHWIFLGARMGRGGAGHDDENCRDQLASKSISGTDRSFELYMSHLQICNNSIFDTFLDIVLLFTCCLVIRNCQSKSAKKHRKTTRHVSCVVPPVRGHGGVGTGQGPEVNFLGKYQKIVAE